MTSKSYSQLLKDPRWQRRRLEILTRDNWECQMCHDKETTLHVHHKHYHKGRMPWDYAEHELVTLCENCHESVDEEEGFAKEVFAKLAVDGPYSKSAAIVMVAGWAHQHCGYDLSEFYKQSPYNFVLGEIATYIDGMNMGGLLDLRDSLVNAPHAERVKALLAAAATLRKQDV